MFSMEHHMSLASSIILIFNFVVSAIHQKKGVAVLIWLGHIFLGGYFSNPNMTKQNPSWPHFRDVFEHHRKLLAFIETASIEFTYYLLYYNLNIT